MRQIDSFSTNSGHFRYADSAYSRQCGQNGAMASACSRPQMGFRGLEESKSFQNRSENDFYDGANKKDNKKPALFFGSIAAAAVLLAIGFNLDKIKKFINNAPKAPKHTAKTKLKPKKSLKSRLSANSNQKCTQKGTFIIGQNGVNTNNAGILNASKQPAAGNIILPNGQNRPISTDIVGLDGQKLYSAGQNTAQSSQKAVTKPILRNNIQKDYDDILALTGKQNLKTKDLKEIERIFKQHTGINLYCPESYNFKDFEGFFEPMIKYNMFDRINPEIKHIIIGHGTGSAAGRNWRFEGNQKSVFDFIESHIPKGEKALLVTCESTKAVKPGVGGPVNISLHAKDRPGKVVKSGIREVIGTAYLLEPNIIRYFNAVN